MQQLSLLLASSRAIIRECVIAIIIAMCSKQFKLETVSRVQISLRRPPVGTTQNEMRLLSSAMRKKNTKKAALGSWMQRRRVQIELCSPLAREDDALCFGLVGGTSTLCWLFLCDTYQDVTFQLFYLRIYGIKMSHGTLHYACVQFGLQPDSSNQLVFYALKRRKNSNSHPRRAQLMQPWCIWAARQHRMQ
jgi:hypothetical protein